jgi:hypothetical protein
MQRAVRNANWTQLAPARKSTKAHIAELIISRLTIENEDRTRGEFLARGIGELSKAGFLAMISGSWWTKPTTAQISASVDEVMLRGVSSMVHVRYEALSLERDHSSKDRLLS